METQEKLVSNYRSCTGPELLAIQINISTQSTLFVRAFWKQLLLASVGIQKAECVLNES